MNLMDRIDAKLDEKKESGWLPIARKVVKDHSMVYIDPKTNNTSEDKKRGYTILDATTANMLITIADALSKESNQKFTSMPLSNAVTIGWKLIKK